MYNEKAVFFKEWPNHHAKFFIHKNKRNRAAVREMKNRMFNEKWIFIVFIEEGRKENLCLPSLNGNQLFYGVVYCRSFMLPLSHLRFFSLTLNCVQWIALDQSWKNWLSRFINFMQSTAAHLILGLCWCNGMFELSFFRLTLLLFLILHKPCLSDLITKQNTRRWGVGPKIII